MAGTEYYENLARQPVEEPAAATLADSYFEEAVKAFEAGNFGIAIDKFAKAMLEEVKNWKLGDPRKPETVIGPLITKLLLKKLRN